MPPKKSKTEQYKPEEGKLKNCQQNIGPSQDY